MFSVWQKIVATGEWDLITNLVATADTSLALVDFDIANNKVIKRLTLSEATIAFNKDTNSNNNTIDLETQIVIPPLLPYTLDLQLPKAINPAPAGEERYIVCQIIGTGGIIAPRTTF